jgi:hypothetical protein
MATEYAEFWRRDPVECVRELLSNPAFRDKCHYAPKKAFTNGTETEGMYGEMWTGEWWWKAQVHCIILCNSIGRLPNRAERLTQWCNHRGRHHRI